MKSAFLFPHKYKVIGWYLLVPSFVAGIFVLFTEFELGFLDWKVPWIKEGDFAGSQDNFTNELAMIVLLFASILVAFSKTKEEDEYVQKIRHDSLLWSLYINYALMFTGILVAYNFGFLNVLVFNMYTPLFIFIIRFQYYYSKR